MASNNVREKKDGETQVPDDVPTQAKGEEEKDGETQAIKTKGDETQTVDPSNITKLNIEFTEPSTYKIVKEGGHTVTRNDSKSCFVYVQNSPEVKQEDKKTESNGMFSWLKPKTKVAPTQGGKLKTKKNRKTKKRNQKKGFKSRSKK